MLVSIGSQGHLLYLGDFRERTLVIHLQMIDESLPTSAYPSASVG